MTKRAVLLANLGSPDAPDTSSVRRYLHQFLMDPYVIQLPWPLRKLIVSLFVLPTRPKASAEAYQSVWMKQGSPLIVLSERLRKAVSEKVDIPLDMAMRYGKPSIEEKILTLTADKTVSELLYIPLYPHFADSTVTTSIEEARRVIKKHQLDIKLQVLEPFYDKPDYIDALVKSAEPYLARDYDHIVFSYHGLPESHITELDSTGSHCLKQENCCQVDNPVVHKTCYRHQVMRTTECFTKQVGLAKERYSVAFQSRLGRAKWLGPNTEDRLQELAKDGAKNVLVICPAFVTDCLETLEEIAIRGEEVFKEAGGQTLTLVPCMNDHDAWVEVLAKWCRHESNTTY
ncbi:ferrochelatase [Methylophaga sp.]|uniref:ferrochelatase n=1 Tax=Methylophaga sp. TaxID=2024840 RepID=UPI003F695EA8